LDDTVKNGYREVMARPRSFDEGEVLRAARDQFWSAGYAARVDDIKQDADPARLAGLLLAVLRGIEALGKGGSSPDSLRAIAETALALLPLP
jgi:hypothetical protein